MAKKLAKGSTRDVIDSNVKQLVAGGYTEANATRVALRHARKGSGKAKMDKVAAAVAAPSADVVKVSV